MVEANVAKMKRMAKAFKALSNPNRLQIYMEIIEKRSTQLEGGLPSGCGLADFICKLNVGAPTVSHHIKELVNADLITVELNGKFMTCFLNEPMYNQLKDFFDGALITKGSE